MIVVSAPPARWPSRQAGACAAAGSDGNGLPCAHSYPETLAVVASVRYRPNQARRLLAQRAGAVIGRSYRNRGLKSLRSIVPNLSPLQHCARPVPVSRVRPEVAAHQKSSGAEGHVLSWKRVDHWRETAYPHAVKETTSTTPDLPDGKVVMLRLEVA